MISKHSNRFHPRAVSAAALLLAAFSVPLSAHGETIHFGNFAPGTLIKWASGGGEEGDTGAENDPWTHLQNQNYAAVSFTTGAQSIEITTVDLALKGSSTEGFILAVTAADFPSTGPALFTLDTAQTIPSGAPERISFTADAAVRLTPNTTYYLQLQWDPDDVVGIADWYEAINLAPILSDYSNYALGYGGNVSYDTGVDGGAYYITATVVPEPGETGVVIGGALLAGLGVRAWRRRGACAAV